MTSVTNSVKYPAITVKNVYCDNIRVNKCNINDNYIATFAFDAAAGIHGLLLAEVKKQYKESSYVVSNIAINITCDPVIIDKSTTVINFERIDTDSPSASKSRRHSHNVLSIVRLDSVAERRPVLMSRVDITFRDVFIHKDSSTGKDTWFVDYSSFDSHVLSPMRVCEHIL